VVFSGPGDLRRATFLSADLREADLGEADLTGTVFGSASSHAGYERAEPTDLRGADFSEVRNIERAEFVRGGVIHDLSTDWGGTLPSNVPPSAPAAGITESPEQCTPLMFALD
jgi:uncharacterized protein YjbI with pentapeptide repeats